MIIEVLTMMSMKITFLWDFVLCSLAETYRRFGVACGVHACAVSRAVNYNIGKVN
jgi:hypothetical protein